MEILYIIIPSVLLILFVFRWNAVKIEDFPREVLFKDTFRRVFFMQAREEIDKSDECGCDKCGCGKGR